MTCIVPDKALLRLVKKFHDVLDVLANNLLCVHPRHGGRTQGLPRPSAPFLAAFDSAATAKDAKPYRNPNIAALNINGLSRLWSSPHVNDSSSSGFTTDLHTTPYGVMGSMTPADDDGGFMGEPVRPSTSSTGATNKSTWLLSGYNANPNPTSQVHVAQSSEDDGLLGTLGKAFHEAEHGLCGAQDVFRGAAQGDDR